MNDGSKKLIDKLNKFANSYMFRVVLFGTLGLAVIAAVLFYLTYHVPEPPQHASMGQHAGDENLRINGTTTAPTTTAPPTTTTTTTVPTTTAMPDNEMDDIGVLLPSELDHSKPLSFHMEHRFVPFLKERGVDPQNIGLSYMNLETGDTYSNYGDEPFRAASTIKVAMAMYCYDCAFHGTLDLDTEITYDSSRDWEGGTGALQYYIEDGDSYPISKLLKLAIVESDNIATQMIFHHWSGDDGPLGKHLDEAYGLDYQANTQVTSDQMMRLLERLYKNPEDNPYYPELRERMKVTSYNGCLTASIPHEDVSRKYGVWDEYLHEIAIINLPEDLGGDHYIVTCYTYEVPDNYSFMDEIGAEMFQYLCDQRVIEMEEEDKATETHVEDGGGDDRQDEQSEGVETSENSEQDSAQEEETTAAVSEAAASDGSAA